MPEKNKHGRTIRGSKEEYRNLVDKKFKELTGYDTYGEWVKEGRPEKKKRKK